MDASDIFYCNQVLVLRYLVGHTDVDIQYVIEYMGMELRRKVWTFMFVCVSITDIYKYFASAFTFWPFCVLLSL